MKYYVEECDLGKFAKLEVVEKGDVTELIFKIEPDAPVVPEKITVRWNEPVTETFSFWGPNVGTQRHLAPSWGPRMSCSRLASGAPAVPFEKYPGEEKLRVQAGNPHPYPNYPAMGLPFAAFIQYYR